MKETLNFAIKLGPDNAQFAGVVPHPGTVLYDECTRKGYLRANKWEDFAAHDLIIETEDFSMKDVETMRQYAYRKFYFRPQFILKTALRMSSLREIKRVWRGFLSIMSRVFFYNPGRLQKIREKREQPNRNRVDSFELVVSNNEFRPHYPKN
jgi:radical SAM superfamily enzyme YgiQ (UPF0313 family)